MVKAPCLRRFVEMLNIINIVIPASARRFARNKRSSTFWIPNGVSGHAEENVETAFSQLSLFAHAS
ncbi:MAG: hypothetical protein DME90_03270 [Verrucomicrobia bacterium]|nr:MAG: hypothetical protein DME90_03270 [Verrucomicrobiota bacterium]